MEDNKINRRSRPRPRSLPRPYDLRRKVLLKNFLREQMTYIPHIRMASSLQNNDANFSVQSNSFDLGDLDVDLTELNDENSSSSVSGAGNSNTSENVVENDSITDANDGGNVNNTVSDAVVNIKATDVPAPEPKFFRFTSLMNLRSESKKKKVKGILKAKKMCKSVKSPVKKSFKTGLKRLLSDRSRTSSEKPSSERTSRNSSKSLFSIFKSRRDQRKIRDVERTKQSTSGGTRSTCTNDKNYTSNQSVQTDDRWVRAELSKVEQSNRLLREENRLLSESLSYFMSTSSLDSQLSNSGSPLQSSNTNRNGLRKYPGSYDNLSTSVPYSYDNGNPRSRILRSKSVQEHSDRRNVSRNNYRTRSMNYHNNRVDSQFIQTSSAVSPFTSQTQPYVIPRVRKKNILVSLPINGTGRVVQRRSSMPERVLSENDRSRICRRSGSVRDSSRTPFHSLPAEAFY